MDAPPGFENTIGVGKVCKLKKSLYGLKQSLRGWFEKFTKSVPVNASIKVKGITHYFSNIEIIGRLRP